MIRRLTDREKKIFTATLAAVIVAFFYNGLIGPLQEKREMLAEEITIKRAQLEDDLMVLEDGQDVDARYYAYLKQFRQSGSDEETASSILSEVERVSGELGLRVTDLKPQRIETGQYESRFSVSLTINSELIDIDRFLYTLQQPPYFYDIGQVEFSKIERRGQSTMTTHLVLGKAFVPASIEGQVSEYDINAEETSLLRLPIAKPKPFDVYAARLDERNLFRSLKEQRIVESPALKKALPALHQRIKLIGILVDDDPKAIVEDLKEKQTHFLSRGESLGTVLLEEIREDKVIFKYNNEQVEMTP